MCLYKCVNIKCLWHIYILWEPCYQGTVCFMLRTEPTASWAQAHSVFKLHPGLSELKPAVSSPQMCYTSQMWSHLCPEFVFLWVFKTPNWYTGSGETQTCFGFCLAEILCPDRQVNLHPASVRGTSQQSHYQSKEKCSAVTAICLSRAIALQGFNLWHKPNGFCEMQERSGDLLKDWRWRHRF